MQANERMALCRMGRTAIEHDLRARHPPATVPIVEKPPPNSNLTGRQCASEIAEMSSAQNYNLSGRHLTLLEVVFLSTFAKRLLLVFST